MADQTPSKIPNPRGKKPGDRRLSPRTAPSSAMWYVLGFLLLLALANAFFFSLQSGQTVSYSDFKTAVREGRVQEVIVAEDRIRGQLKQAPEKGTANFTAIRIEDPKLIEDLEKVGVKYTGEVANRWMAEVLGWVIPLIFLVALWSFFFRRMGGAEGGVMSFARSRAKIYADDDVKVRFGDVAGVDEAEDELREIVEFLKTPKKYTSIGGRIPKGVLLVGPPGTGKTLLARAVAGEATVPFFSLSGSEFVEMFVGVGAARVRDLFNQAEAKAPCIIFIDELDALGKVRIQTPMGSHEEREQTLNQLLAEMDGFDARKGIIIMAATNRPEVLDPALLRPGRFDRQVLVDKPDVRGREDILRIHVKNVKMSDAVDLKVIAARTAGFAGADLANLVNEAALLAARRDKVAVDMKDFDEAIDRLIAGLEKKRVMNTKERRLVAFHESGHAIVATVLPNLDPVHKISIVARGFGALGYTMQLPLEDRYLMTKQDLQSQLAVLLGGRSAEEIAFGEVSTGAQNDLQRATDIARAMVTEFGMSETLGVVNYNGHKRSAFLDTGFMQERGNYAEDTAQKIDAEVKRILTAAHDEARRILREHRHILDELSERLLIKEVIEGDELRALMGPVPPKDPDAVPAEIPPPAPISEPERKLRARARDHPRFTLGALLGAVAAGAAARSAGRGPRPGSRQPRRSPAASMRRPSGVPLARRGRRRWCPRPAVESDRSHVARLTRARGRSAVRLRSTDALGPIPYHRRRPWRLPRWWPTPGASTGRYLAAGHGAVRGNDAGKRITIAAGADIRNADIALPDRRGDRRAGDRRVRRTAGADRRCSRRASTAGTDSPQRVSHPPALTDDLGRYRIYGLEPGTYVVGAAGQLLHAGLRHLRGHDLFLSVRPMGRPSRSSPRSTRRPLPRRRPQQDCARDRRMSPESTSLLQRTRRFKLSGIVVDSQGQPAASSRSVRADPPRTRARSTSFPLRTDPQGRFEFARARTG